MLSCLNDCNLNKFTDYRLSYFQTINLAYELQVFKLKCYRRTCLNLRLKQVVTINVSKKEIVAQQVLEN